MRTPGSPKLPSLIRSVAAGFTASPAAAPHECMMTGHCSDAALPFGAGAHVTA